MLDRAYRKTIYGCKLVAIPKGDGKHIAIDEMDGDVKYHDLDFSAEESRAGWTVCKLPPGLYYPRIHRASVVPGLASTELGGDDPSRTKYEAQFVGSVHAVGSILHRLVDVFRFVEPTSDNADAYGHEIRHLLILACTEVEASCRAVLGANGYDLHKREKREMRTKDYVRLADPMRLGEWSVALNEHRSWQKVRPFHGWDAEASTKSLEWYDAYNATKHDRETGFRRATLRHAITAAAAAYLMVVAQFGMFDTGNSLGMGCFSIDSAPIYPPADLYVPPLPEGNWSPVHFFGSAG